MTRPLTADRRDERFAEYLKTLKKWELSDVRSERLSRVSDLRKKLAALLDEIIQERAEALATAIVEQYSGEKRERSECPAFGPLEINRRDGWRRYGTK